MTTAYRPDKRVAGLDFQTFTVASGQTVRAGMGVKMAATDTSPATSEYPQAQEAIADTDLVDAIAYGEPGTSWTAGQQFPGVIPIGAGVIPIRVGTGGVTRPGHIVPASDGFTNAPANGNGTTRIFSPGTALETSATAGDFVGMRVRPAVIAKT